MSRQVVFLLALMAWILGGVATYARPIEAVSQCNYDLTNTSGKEFFDLEVILKGVVTVSNFWNIDFSGIAPIVTTTPEGNTSLHWMYPTAGSIPHGRKVHVGYTPAGTEDCPVQAIYWTNENHERVSSSFIGIVHNYLKGTSQQITNLSRYSVNVYDVQMACQEKALPLDALNATNEDLAKAMIKIADSATLEPEQTWEIPVTPSCHKCYCVTNFKTSGEGLDAIYSPWVQEYVE